MAHSRTVPRQVATNKDGYGNQCGVSGCYLCIICVCASACICTCSIDIFSILCFIVPSVYVNWKLYIYIYIYCRKKERNPKIFRERERDIYIYAQYEMCDTPMQYLDPCLVTYYLFMFFAKWIEHEDWIPKLGLKHGPINTITIWCFYVSLHPETFWKLFPESSAESCQWCWVGTRHNLWPGQRNLLHFRDLPTLRNVYMRQNHNKL